MASERIAVEVVVALPERAWVVPLALPPGSTVLNAIERARLDQLVPELDPASCSYGVHGRRRPPGTMLRDGDRVEVYRPLVTSPKARRRAQAARTGER